MNAHQLFETVTNQIVADIEAGAGQWQMPWHRLADAGTPHSVDGRPYRGINALWLPLVSTVRDWPLGLWATYRAWQRHGCQVRRGEKGTTVVLWKEIPRRGTPADQASDPDRERDDRPRWFARGYAVFAAEQVDGASEILAQRAACAITGRDTPERIAAAEGYFARLGAPIVEGGSRAYYSPVTDTIHVPTLAQFDDAPHFYGTVAHESVHWTGHPGRLARDHGQRFGDDAYAAEELVAELGAAMWCAQAGLSAATRRDHASYLAGWLRVLRANPRHLVTVASQAQAAIDWMNTRAGADRVPSQAAVAAA